MEDYPSKSLRKTTLAQRKGKVNTHGAISKAKSKVKIHRTKGKSNSKMAGRHGVTEQPKDNSATHTATAKPSEGSQALSSEVPVFRFHDPKYKYFKLSKDRQTVENRDLESPHLFVLSEEPMMPNMLYQVEILTTEEDMVGTTLGVVAKSPDTVKFTDLWKPGPEVVNVSHAGIWVKGEWKMEERPVLKDVAVGSKVGLAVDSDRSLHLYVDGKQQGVVAPDIPTPCYFMFYLCKDTKVRALPVTSVT